MQDSKVHVPIFNVWGLEVASNKDLVQPTLPVSPATRKILGRFFHGPTLPSGVQASLDAILDAFNRDQPVLVTEVSSRFHELFDNWLILLSFFRPLIGFMRCA